MTHSSAEDQHAPSMGQIERIMQAVNELPPWAYTYRERPDDLLEVRASELQAILRDVLWGASSDFTPVFVDELMVEARGTQISGRQLRAVAKVGADTDLWLVTPGLQPDELVHDENVYRLPDVLRFFTAPRQINR